MTFVTQKHMTFVTPKSDVYDYVKHYTYLIIEPHL